MNSLIRNAIKIRSISSSMRIFSNQKQFFSGKQTEMKDFDPNEPIKFLGSKAQAHRATQTRTGYENPDEFPWFQPFVVVGSVAVFLIYFLALREENDIDAHLSKPLFDSVPGLEKSTLISLYKYNLEHKIDNTTVIKRMLELGIDPLTID